MSVWDADVDLTVEAAFGFGPLATPTWTDISPYVRQVTTERRKSRILDETQAGQATLVLKNNDSRFDPANTDGPYSPDVKVNTPIRVFAVHDTVTYHLFRGFAVAWPQKYPGVKDSVVEVPCLDAFRLMAMSETELTKPAAKSGTRIGSLLDTLGWPAGWRNLDTGTHDVAAITGEFNSILGEIRRAVLVEQGLFWVAGNGDATFRDANTRIQDRTVAATFDDPNALSYSLPVFDYDDTQLWNQATVTRRDGIPQTSTNGSSVTAYGKRDLHLSETLHVADGEALAMAQWLTGEHSDIRLRVSELTLYPMKDPTNLWPVALGLDFWDMVNIKRTPPGGSALDVNCFVDGVSHEISKVGAKRWNTTIGLSPDLPHDDWWILGSSELGVDTRLGY